MRIPSIGNTDAVMRAPSTRSGSSSPPMFHWRSSTSPTADERATSGADVHVVGVGPAAFEPSLTRERGVHVHDPVGIRERQRPEQQRVHRREHGDVRRDAERQTEDRDDRVPR